MEQIPDCGSGVNGASDTSVAEDGCRSWNTGDYTIQFRRMIVEVAGNLITVDLPLTQAINGAVGAGFVNGGARVCAFCQIKRPTFTFHAVSLTNAGILQTNLPIQTASSMWVCETLPSSLSTVMGSKTRHMLGMLVRAPAAHPFSFPFLSAHSARSDDPVACVPCAVTFDEIKDGFAENLLCQQFGCESTHAATQYSCLMLRWVAAQTCALASCAMVYT